MLLNICFPPYLVLLQVSDIKFQAPSGEEKESWIKALNEGINRGKNKAFDEVCCHTTIAGVIVLVPMVMVREAQGRQVSHEIRIF